MKTVIHPQVIENLHAFHSQITKEDILINDGDQTTLYEPKTTETFQIRVLNVNERPQVYIFVRS